MKDITGTIKNDSYIVAFLFWLSICTGRRQVYHFESAEYHDICVVFTSSGCKGTEQHTSMLSDQYQSYIESALIICPKF